MKKYTIGSIVIVLLLTVSYVHKGRKAMKLMEDRRPAASTPARPARSASVASASVPMAAAAATKPQSAQARAAERKRAYEAFLATQPAPTNALEERALEAAFNSKQTNDAVREWERLTRPQFVAPAAAPSSLAPGLGKAPSPPAISDDPYGDPRLDVVKASPPPAAAPAAPSAGASLSPPQLTALAEAKKQSAAGLISQPIYEELQRKILGLPAPQAPASAPARHSEVVARLVSGFWRLQITGREKGYDRYSRFPGDKFDQDVLRFNWQKGTLRLTRFRQNNHEEPGRGAEVPLSDVSIEDRRVTFRLKYLGESQTSFEVTLGEKAGLKVQERGPLSEKEFWAPREFWELTPVLVRTDAGWDAWYRMNSTEALMKELGPVSEIWQTDGKPAAGFEGERIVVWYNAVAVERTLLDEFAGTLRPLMLKTKKTPEGSFITHRFDHMADLWMEFPVKGVREKTTEESLLIGMAGEPTSEAEWRALNQVRRDLLKSRGIRPKAEIPLKDGGIRRTEPPPPAAPKR